MEELKWGLLTQVQGRAQADILKAYFDASGIEVELFQESLGQHIYPTTLDILGNVQIFVPKAQMAVARKLLKEYYNPPQDVVEGKEKPAIHKSRTTPKKTVKPVTSKSTKRKSK